MNFAGALPLLLSAAVFACGCSPERDGRETVAVFAASSLTEAFQSLEKQYEAEHPRTDIKLAFAGSQALRLQIESGARADVFASANEAHWSALAEAGRADGQPTGFASNELVLVVGSHDTNTKSIEDLGPGDKLVIGAKAVPAGQYASHVFERARSEFGNAFAHRLESAVVSEEANVRLVRAKVALGEADAAFVYRSDAELDDRVKVVALPEPLRVRATYYIGTTSSKPGARAFVRFVKSPRGQEVLTEHGFGSAVQ